ncbi:MAG: hypothetical protein AAGG51_31180, partial [Cyanobacteria bacterium P01_G01_bin.54]
ALILAGVVAAQLRTKPKRKQLNTAYRPTSRLKIDPGDGQPLPTEAPVSYRLQKALFSPAEKVFYDSLNRHSALYKCHIDNKANPQLSK